MNYRHMFIKIPVVLIFLLILSNAQAAVVLSNLDATHADSACASSVRAEGFTTGNIDPYSLSSVTYRLVDAGGTLDLYLYSDAGGKPGNVIASIDSQSIGTTGVDIDYTFTPAASIPLANSTRYWLVAISSNCSQALAAVGEVPSGLFTYNGAMMATSYDLVSNTYSWVSVTPSAILAVSVTGGSFWLDPQATSAAQNSNFSYSFCVLNSNTSAASVLIESNIPDGSSFVSASGSYSTTAMSVIWSLNSVPVGGPSQCVDMVVNVQAPAGSSLAVNASLTSDQPFIPTQLNATTPVVAPATSGGGGGTLGLLGVLSLLLTVAWKKRQNSN